MTVPSAVVVAGRAARPVPWIPPVLYTVVAAGGIYHSAVAPGVFHPVRTAAFVAGLALLLALEAPERLGLRPPSAAVLLALRAVLFTLVAAADGSGVSRALFVLVPFTAFFAFGRRAALGCAAGCVGLLLTAYTLRVPHWWVDPAYVSDLLMFGLALALALSMAAVAVGEQEARSRLEQSHQRLAHYAARVAELSTAEERNRVAREIHDSLGHHLTAVGVQLEKAEAFRTLDPASSAQALADARWSAGRALAEVRESVSALRDTRPFSLARSLADLVRHLGDDRLTVALSVTGDEAAHDAATLTTLYRAAQEALTNARRHGHATRVEVVVALAGPSARLTVSDNGRGLGGGWIPGHGIRGMRERVALLGGEVDVRGGREGGVTVTVTLPCGVPAETVAAL
ncbi:sensor histidine kinase [Streptomyces sp. CB01881]|uniref:sensor histidine kinase n=1 Tax=Streptomyces sp. CB01881 TaxID=2078691 RepID=UPI000CDBD6CC|nr:sensor histidine kinase [Streptomyces sp. CB01881]AUY48070.1 sensor histidine kinase [Streptomyces sp. CB01881]TYC76554.1 sensor histidine kinase [Streptomyces sp. CB01881]